MVALLTPDSSAIASMLVASMPRSANSSTAAFRTLSCASALLGLTIRLNSIHSVSKALNFDFRKQVCAQTQEDQRDRAQHAGVQGRMKVPLVDQRSAQSIHPVRQRIEPGDHFQHHSQVG